MNGVLEFVDGCYWFGFPILGFAGSSNNDTHWRNVIIVVCRGCINFSLNSETVKI